MPYRFEEPEATPVGEYPAHMPVALQFGKFVERMGDRVHVSTKSSHVRFNIGGEIFRVDKSDTKLIDAMTKWQVYDKMHPLNVRYFVSPTDAFMYARFGMKREWPEAEPYIIKDPHYASWYASDVLNRRWPEAEQYIMKDSHFWNEYKKYFNIP